MIPVVSDCGIGEFGLPGGCYRLLSIGDGEYALFQIPLLPKGN